MIYEFNMLIGRNDFQSQKYMQKMDGIGYKSSGRLIEFAK